MGGDSHQPNAANVSGRADNKMNPMKTIAKLSFATLAAALTISASADDVKLEVLSDGHGGTRLQYRAPESPTIAVYAQGRGTGLQMAADSNELRLEFRDSGHGSLVTQYVVMK